MDDEILDENSTLTDSERFSVRLGISLEALRKAEADCKAVYENTTSAIPEPFCPWTFDGWACWNDTPAGTVAYTKCPSFMPGYDPKHSTGTANRICLDNGSWFTHPESNLPWSNFTNCIDLSSLNKHQTVNKVYLAGYGISVAALLISLFIFFYYRSLKCKRVTIHKNLFCSFLVNNTLWLIWLIFVSEKVKVLSANSVGCRILHVIMHYFLVSNYMWMFCEGLYLHTLLVVAFVSEERIIKWFLAMGWGVPFTLMFTYTMARMFDEKANMHCWMEETAYNYIYSVPVFISLLLNLGFLVNIVYVLVTKLRSANTAQDNSSTRKAVRATLILIPLLGLHYMLVPFRPPPGTVAENVFLILSAVASSFQGLAVSLLFCLCNGEVIAIWKRKWNQRAIMRSPKAYNQATSVSYMKTSMADGVTLTTTFNTNADGEDV